MKVFRKIINSILVISLLYILVVDIVFDRKEKLLYYYDVPIDNYWIVLIILAVLFAIGVYIVKSGRRKSSLAGAYELKQPKDSIVIRNMGIVTACLFVAQLIIVRRIFFYVGWDLQTLRGLASKAVLGTEYDSFYDPYLQVNPNNIWMYCYNKLAFSAGKLFGINGYFFLVAAAIVVVAISVFITGIAAYRIIGNAKIAYAVFAVAILFVGLSPWISVPYSDCFAMIIPICIILEYKSLKDEISFEKWDDKKLLAIKGKKLFCILLLAMIGYHLKPISCVPIIAIIAVEILRLKKPTRVEVIAALMALILSALLATGINKGFEKYAGYIRDERIEKPMTHYLMMGLNTESIGGYTFLDDDYTSNIYGIKEKETANLKRSKERLEEMGVDGFFTHLKNKTLMNFNNGILGWGKEINFAAVDAGDIWAKSGGLAGILKNFYYVKGIKYTLINFAGGGKYFFAFATIFQFIWMAILILSFIGSVKVLKSDDDVLSVLGISVLGSILFVTIFETNSRYLYCFMPMFLVLAGQGLKLLKELFVRVEKGKL